MQAFGNVATAPVRKESKATGKGYFEFRIAESQRNQGPADQPTWFSVRLMKDVDPGLSKGDFVKVTGKLKADFYLSREGKPTGTLLIIAFEAAKIAKPATQPVPASEAPPQEA
jgi:single-stranded DNA-binding protein